MEEEIRLQKYLAEQGIASRRTCDEYIRQGLVEVNGETVTQFGMKINPEKDVIKFQGKEVARQKKVYLLLNKPIGYVTTTKDQFNRDMVLDLVKISQRVVPVRKIRHVYFRSTDSNK